MRSILRKWGQSRTLKTSGRLGLVAAIPAVIIYNHFSRKTKLYLELLGHASGSVARLLSRDLDRNFHGGLLSRKMD